MNFRPEIRHTFVFVLHPGGQKPDTWKIIQLLTFQVEMSANVTGTPQKHISRILFQHI